MTIYVFNYQETKMSTKLSYKEKLNQIQKTHNSPQAEALRKMLEDDNERLFKYLDESNDLKTNVPMEEEKLQQISPTDASSNQEAKPQSAEQLNGYQAFQNDDD